MVIHNTIIHLERYWKAQMKNMIMQFISLNKASQLDAIAASANYEVILKHNTTCAISEGVLGKMEASELHIPGVQQVYLLDLLENRAISNEIATRFDVEHKSPQLLLIKQGKCIYTEWGSDITAEAIKQAIEGQSLS